MCLPGAMIEHVTERIEKIMGRRNEGTIIVHVRANNTDKEGTTAIVEKYRKLLKKTKQARMGQIIISEMLPVFGNRIQGYVNSKIWHCTGWLSGFAKKRMWDTWICGRALGEIRHARKGWFASEWQGGSSFCWGNVRGGRQRLG